MKKILRLLVPPVLFIFTAMMISFVSTEDVQVEPINSIDTISIDTIIEPEIIPTLFYGHFKSVYDLTLGFEGGFQNDKDDSGNKGPNGTYLGTNHGITPIAFKGRYGRWPSESEMRNLNVDSAAMIAKNSFWDRMRGDSIKSLPIAYYTFDWFYGSWLNSIPKIKRAINNCYAEKVIVEDRTITNELIKLLNNTEPERLYAEMQKERARHYKAIVKHSPIKKKYIRGWLKRVKKYKYKDLI
jgi:lysozyme family protein